MTITLTNTSRRIATFTLPHADYCKTRGQCACAIRRGGARVPSSVTVTVGVHVRGLDDAVLQVPAIALAVKRGALRIDRDAPPAPAPIAPIAAKSEGGPEGAPTTHVEVPNESRAAVVEDRR